MHIENIDRANRLIKHLRELEEFRDYCLNNGDPEHFGIFAQHTEGDNTYGTSTRLRLTDFKGKIIPLITREIEVARVEIADL